MLLSTGRAQIAEASPFDRYWGTGRGMSHAEMADPGHWPGKNMLGVLLMQLRDELLRAESDKEVKETKVDEWKVEKCETYNLQSIFVEFYIFEELRKI